MHYLMLTNETFIVKFYIFIRVCVLEISHIYLNDTLNQYVFFFFPFCVCVDK